MLILEPDGTMTHGSALPTAEPTFATPHVQHASALREPALRYEFDVMGLGTVALCIGDDTATAVVQAPHRFTAVQVRGR